MLKNKKGFTVVEVLVAFAILAVAGTMMLLGLRNVSMMIAEGTQIKSTTNELYYDLLDQDLPTGETIPSTVLEVKVRDENSENQNEITIQKIYVVQKKGEAANTEISLSRIISLESLNWLPYTPSSSE